MFRDNTWILPVLCFCIYPILSPIVASAAWRWLRSFDWRNINWQGLKNINRRDDEL